MDIERTHLYKEMRRRVEDVPAGPKHILDAFDSALRKVVEEEGKYIVLTFPEYTPHDHPRHLNNLFSLADRVLGNELYARLTPTEVVLLVFALYAHDWGMAVSDSQRKILRQSSATEDIVFVTGEPARAIDFLSEATTRGSSLDKSWQDYIRSYNMGNGARCQTQETVGILGNNLFRDGR